MHQFRPAFGIFASALVLTSMLALAAPRLALADGGTVDFNISEQSLSNALNEFARQSDRQILYSTDIVNGKQSPGLKGTFEPEAGLRQLLAGAGLSFHVNADHTILVEAPRTAYTPISMGSDLHLAQAGQPSATATVAAASAPPQNEAAPDDVAEVTVTGTRIVRNGYEAPTPVTVVGVEAIQDAAKPNIAEVLNQMPVFQNSATPTTTTVSNSGQAGGNNLNLRNLGSNRTLVLFDGRRYPPEFVTNVVDVNLMPDALVSRVDIVTGGASAVYGSDALAGVVNFVLDTNFTGVKGTVQGGVSTHGDGWEDKVSVAFGTRFANDRGHFLLELDQAYEAQIDGDQRDWNLQGYSLIQNPAYTANNGAPSLITRKQVGLSAGWPGGIISGGALRGTAFGAGGTPFKYNYGSLTSGSYNVGGDWAESSMMGAASLRVGSNTKRLFTHASFALTDNIELFAEYSNAFVHTDSRCCYDYYLGNLTLRTDNAFIPASIAPQVAAAYPGGTFPYGITLRQPDEGFGTIISRWNNVYVVGAKGKFDALGTNWSWNTYAQKGIATMEFYVPYQSNTANFMQAIDAVHGPGGSIVCRSTLTNPGNGCVPYDLFGTDVVTQAMVDYTQGGPYLRQTLAQSVAGGGITGEPFSTWAGPVSVAASAEWRKDSIEGFNDPVSDARGWFSTQLTAFDASQHVVEGALETVVPLAKDIAFAKTLELNAGVRATDYSTSGYVTTWKVGLNWQVIDDVRLRATQSRDIRAPNLNDLFATPQTNHNTIPDPFKGNASFAYFQVNLGNPDLKPEEADTTGLGIVYQPAWLPGFQTSVDYYRINTKGAISTVTYAYTLSQCYAGVQAYCDNITRLPNGNLDAIFLRPQNQASLLAKGVDIETSYQMHLGPGNLGLRLVATDTLNLVTDSGIPGPTQVLDQAGTGPVARWSVNANIAYSLDPFRVSWTTRFITAGDISNTLYECSSGCPNLAGSGLQTVDYNKVPSYTVSNLSASWRFLDQGSRRNADVFLNIDNIFDKDPPLYPSQIAGASYAITTNAALYDSIGRVFRAGIRFRM